jgi:hypothetical protein
LGVGLYRFLSISRPRVDFPGMRHNHLDRVFVGLLITA